MLVLNEGQTKLRAAGVALTFLEAERFCLDETNLDNSASAETR